MKTKLKLLLCGAIAIVTIATRQSTPLASTTEIVDDGRVIRIPVVFHVLYFDTSQNVSTEKIKLELESLRKDFLMINLDLNTVANEFVSRIGNPNIEFYLADTILQVGGENGIIRKLTTSGVDRFSVSPVINSKKYLNVYIGDFGFVGSTNYLPWNNKNTDAVSLDYEYIGDCSRVFTHEVGHWLGLLHIYGGSGKMYGDCCTKGDEIDDTPEQRRATNLNCDKCPPVVKERRCKRKVATNYNNFMDYSGCRSMFTKGQVAHMRKIIIENRKELY